MSNPSTTSNCSVVSQVVSILREVISIGVKAVPSALKGCIALCW